MYASKFALTRRSPRPLPADATALADYPRLATGQIVHPAGEPAGTAGGRPVQRPTHRPRGRLHHSARIG